MCNYSDNRLIVQVILAKNTKYVLVLLLKYEDFLLFFVFFIFALQNKNIEDNALGLWML